MTDRVRVADYGRLAAEDPRLWPVPSVAGRQCHLHWSAALALSALQRAWEASGGEGLLLVASGWRRHRWRDRAHYEATLVDKYQGRTDLACKQGSPPVACPCMPRVRRACLYLAYDSAHETGLAMDLGSHGLAPVSRTIARQRRTALHCWLETNAAESGWQRLPSEPWHIEHVIPRDVWALSGPEAG